MRRALHRVVLVSVLAVWAGSAFGIDPARSLDQNVIRTWSVDDGLPQGTVTALAQTSDGYLWAATQEGFVRFDGTEFAVYDKASSPQLRANLTHALLATRDGSLWAAINGGGVVHVDGRRLTSIGAADGLPSDTASALLESGDGSIWIGTQRGV